MSSSDSFEPTWLRLLCLGVFSRHERARIASDLALTAALRTAEPSAWRKLFDEHAAAARARLPRLTPEDGAPMRRQALHDLDTERQSLASLHDGRKDAVYRAAARLARYAANGVLTSHEIEAGLIEAWHASGAAAKHGLDYPPGAIRRALEAGCNDPLPPLMRCFRRAEGGGR